MKKEWHTKKWVTILIHAGAWILLFSLPYLLRPSYNPNDVKRPEPADPTTIFIISRISDVLLVSFFYLNALLLIPRLLYKKKYAFYTFAILFSFVCFVLIIWTVRLNFAGAAQIFASHKIVNLGNQPYKL